MEAAAAVSLPLVAEGGEEGAWIVTVKLEKSMPCTDSHGTEQWRLVQKLWGNSARNLLLGCFYFPLCMLVQDAVSNDPFLLCCEIMRVGLSASRGQVTYIPSVCEYH